MLYQTTIKGMGDQVEAFVGEGIFVTFGDNAPDTLKDFCYSVEVTPVQGEEYEAIDLPVVQEEIGTFKLCYRNRVLSASFVGDNRDEISVASAMKKYKEEAVRFAEQGMMSTGYLKTRMY